MKTGQGFLLVFSITSRASLQELATLREEIIRIKDDENIPIVIVGNKADLVDQRAVDRAKAFAISQRWQAPYYEASARTRCAPPFWICHCCIANMTLANVDEVFIDLCRQLLRRDDSDLPQNHDDIYYQKAEDHSSSRRRHRRKNKEHRTRCVIL